MRPRGMCLALAVAAFVARTAAAQAPVRCEMETWSGDGAPAVTAPIHAGRLPRWTRRLVTDSIEWATLWREMHEDVWPSPALPTLDFHEQRVVVVAMGTQMNRNGQRIALEGARVERDTLVLTVRSHWPNADQSPACRSMRHPGGCGALYRPATTQPTAAYLIPPMPAAVRFEERHTFDC